jgi:choline dehydrogenase
VNIPTRVDTLILGGGTTGAALAGLLAERGDGTILVCEAGPDHGPLGSPGWPPSLVSAAMLGTGVCDWGFTSGLDRHGRILDFERARVIGGCSSHNGCAAIWGAREDYDAWAAGGCDGWSTAELEPFLRASNRRLRVTTPSRDVLTPFQAAAHAAIEAMGIPATGDLNDLDEPQGVSPTPVNIDDGVRFNTAFAYLDPVRGTPGLTIAGDALADRLLVSAGRVVGAEVIVDGRRVRIDAGRTIVCGGAYGSPAILERSGIGDPAVLAAAGIAVTHALPGVGANLHDHPAVNFFFTGTDELVAQMRARSAEGFCPEEQVIAKVRSPLATEAFDLHVYPVGGPYRDGRDGYFFELPVACMNPVSRGTCHVVSADPEALPTLDHGFLTDPGGHDEAVLRAGLDFVREMATREPFASVIGREASAPPDDLREAWIHYYHPVGSCKMGPAGDPTAVVDPRCRIHGLEGGYVADCAIIPQVPRANTNIPAVMIAERIVTWL